MRHCAGCGRRILNPLFNVQFLGRMYHLRCGVVAGLIEPRWPLSRWLYFWGPSVMGNDQLSSDRISDRRRRHSKLRRKAERRVWP